MEENVAKSLSVVTEKEWEETIEGNESVYYGRLMNESLLNTDEPLLVEESFELQALMRADSMV